MSRSLPIADPLSERLEFAARSRGLTTVEQLIELWHFQDEAERQSHEAVGRIDALFAELSAQYGAMPDSVTLVREDRDR